MAALWQCTKPLDHIIVRVSNTFLINGIYTKADMKEVQKGYPKILEELEIPKLRRYSQRDITGEKL